MAFDEELAGRMRELLEGQEKLSEKRMFGGLAFLLDGRMAVCATSHGVMMVRVDPADTDELIADPAAARMIMRGKELDGWITVDVGPDMPEAVLRAWLDRGVGYARSLPPKS